MADIILTPTNEGGLKDPLANPTRSIVFRFVDGALVGNGTVAIIDVEGETQLQAGMDTRARVVFPDAPSDEIFTGRRFELWDGRSIGSAIMVAVESDERA
jgi:hypothetical protein